MHKALLLAFIGSAHGFSVEKTPVQKTTVQKTTASGLDVRPGIIANLSSAELARRVAEADEFIKQAQNSPLDSCSVDYRSSAPGCEQWGAGAEPRCVHIAAWRTDML